MNPLRWGILGAAEIARKNWKAIQLSGNSIVTAVASRDLDRARRFIEVCQADAPFDPPPRALGRYEDLVASDQVDALYIPLPTGLRKPWVLRAAAAGKHIVCEKPCAPTLPDLQEMLEACRSHLVQFMDGVMFVHSQRLQAMGKLLSDLESIGQLRHIASAFSFGAQPEFFDTNIRAHGALEPAGCLGDLGWYCIRLSLWARNWRLPARVTGHRLAQHRRADSTSPVPTEFSGQLLFEDGVSASFFCSFLAQIQQWAVLSGTRGYLRLSDFVLPFEGAEMHFDLVNSSYHVKGCNFSMQPGLRQFTVSEFSQGNPNAQEANLFRNFSDQILSGRLNESWPEQALKTQQVMAACLESAAHDGRPVEL